MINAFFREGINHLSLYINH